LHVDGWIEMVHQEAHLLQTDCTTCYVSWKLSTATPLCISSGLKQQHNLRGYSI